MKVAVITCYKYPDYGRAVVLRSVLLANANHQTIVIKNNHRGVLRYPEVIIRTFMVRLRQRPDVYLLTFRGYEMLPAILLIALGKPVILDELVNPIEVVNEHRQLYKGTLTYRLMGLWLILGNLYNLLLRCCRLVIADTNAHAVYSSKASGLPPERYRVIPVGADESVFKPKLKNPDQKSDVFTVLYYGTMVPLHGLSHVLTAAERLKNQQNINFLLVGGGKKAAKQIANASKRGANIEYLSWVETDKLPALISEADLCLGGPFGNTLQSQLVTTAKTYQFLACSAPVLIGRTKETEGTKLFEDKGNCLLVPQGDADAIAGAIEWAAIHPKALNKIGMAGHQLYNQHFSNTIIGRKMASLLDELY